MVERWWSKTAAATLALAAMLLVAAPVASAEHEEAKANGFDAFFLKGSNGYRVFVVALFRPGYGESSEVFVGAGRKGRTVSYVAPGVVTDKKVEADLGQLGKIDVTLRSSGRIGRVRSACTSGRVPYEKGVYVGTIEFRGEEGYTRVSAERARFSPAVLAGFGCPYAVTDEVFGPHLPGVGLRARTKVGASNLALQVNQGGPGKRVRVLAEIEERLGRISIERAVTSAYPADSFHFAPALDTAVLDPPAPFHGIGVFRREAEPAARWTGSLEVDFPGRSNVSLTGDRFRVSLRHARQVKETRYPSRPNP